MSPRRGFAGAAVLGITVTGAATSFANGCPLLGFIFVGIGIVGLMLVSAKWLPILHKLPLFGAIRPPEVKFHLEGESERMAFDMDPSAPALVLLCAGFQESRGHPITQVGVNAYVVGATDIYRTYQDGQPYEDGGTKLTSPDGPYWAVHTLTIPIGAFLMFFNVTLPEPGEYDVVLTVQSPDLYDKGDHFYRDKLVARGTGPQGEVG